jgi:DNA-binding phage protein
LNSIAKSEGLDSIAKSEGLNSIAKSEGLNSKPNLKVWAGVMKMLPMFLKVDPVFVPCIL